MFLTDPDPRIRNSKIKLRIQEAVPTRIRNRNADKKIHI
jgi:hypothetical protein